jgi:hypothetical protein
MSNFIILMSDEHNPRYSSIYGHPYVQTPNMERLENDRAHQFQAVQLETLKASQSV